MRQVILFCLALGLLQCSNERKNTRTNVTPNSSLELTDTPSEDEDEDGLFGYTEQSEGELSFDSASRGGIFPIDLGPAPEEAGPDLTPDTPPVPTTTEEDSPEADAAEDQVEEEQVAEEERSRPNLRKPGRRYNNGPTRELSYYEQNLLEVTQLVQNVDLSNKRSDYPYIGRLFGYGQSCIGTLISPKIVLSQEACWYDSTNIDRVTFHDSLGVRHRIASVNRIRTTSTYKYASFNIDPRHYDFHGVAVIELRTRSAVTTFPKLLPSSKEMVPNNPGVAVGIHRGGPNRGRMWVKAGVYDRWGHGFYLNKNSKKYQCTKTDLGAPRLVEVDGELYLNGVLFRAARRLSGDFVFETRYECTSGAPIVCEEVPAPPRPGPDSRDFDNGDCSRDIDKPARYTFNNYLVAASPLGRKYPNLFGFFSPDEVSAELNDDATKVTISWNERYAGNIDGYIVERRVRHKLDKVGIYSYDPDRTLEKLDDGSEPENGGPWETIAEVDTATFSYIDDSIEHLTFYEYRVRSQRGDDFDIVRTEDENQAVYVPARPDGSLETPQNFQVKPLYSDKGVDLRWDPVEGATGYYVMPAEKFLPADLTHYAFKDYNRRSGRVYSITAYKDDNVSETAEAIMDESLEPVGVSLFLLAAERVGPRKVILEFEHFFGASYVDELKLERRSVGSENWDVIIGAYRHFSFYSAWSERIFYEQQLPAVIVRADGTREETQNSPFMSRFGLFDKTVEPGVSYEYRLMANDDDSERSFLSASTSADDGNSIESPSLSTVTPNLSSGTGVYGPTYIVDFEERETLIGEGRVFTYEIEYYEDGKKKFDTLDIFETKELRDYTRPSHFRLRLRLVSELDENGPWSEFIEVGPKPKAIHNPIRPADVTNDGVVNSSDRQAINYRLSGLGVTRTHSYDVNNDNEITDEDLAVWQDLFDSGTANEAAFVAKDPITPKLEETSRVYRRPNWETFHTTPDWLHVGIGGYERERYKQHINYIEFEIFRTGQRTSTVRYHIDEEYSIWVNPHPDKDTEIRARIHSFSGAAGEWSERILLNK